MKNFNEWNEVKKSIEDEHNVIGFRDRDVFYIKMGENIGVEQNGKGEQFVRPIVVFKKFNRFMFFGIPLSTQIKNGKFYYHFTLNRRNGSHTENIALLSQMRLYSSKRLLNKIGVMAQDDFENMKNRFKDLLE